MEGARSWRDERKEIMWIAIWVGGRVIGFWEDIASCIGRLEAVLGRWDYMVEELSGFELGGGTINWKCREAGPVKSISDLCSRFFARLHQQQQVMVERRVRLTIGRSRPTI